MKRIIISQEQIPIQVDVDTTKIETRTIIVEIEDSEVKP